jgi:hypothetical protein
MLRWPHQEVALLREIESIGKALEEMQAQNASLARLLRERDDNQTRLFADVWAAGQRICACACVCVG